MDLILRPGLSSVAAIGAAPNANGASVAGTVLTLQPASASFGGLITAGTQTIAGAKTFLSLILSQPAGAAGISLDPNAATGAFALALSPANLTATRRWSFPDRSDTVAGLGAQTFTGAQNVGDGTAFVTVVANGSTSGAAGGAWLGASNAGVISVAIGNKSALIGGGYSNLPYIYGSTTITTTVGLNIGGVTTVTASTASTSTTTGALVVTGGVGIGGRLNVGSTTIIGTDPGGSEQFRVGGGIRANGLSVFTAGITADNAQPVRIAGAAGTYRAIQFDTGSTRRWLITANDSAESGANTGTDLEVARYADGGAYLSSPFLINRASGLVTLGTTVIGTDPGGSEVLRVGGSLAVNSATLIKSNTTLTDGAAAAVGTLTNAPTAGNPTKWVLINDNGTIRKFPTWT